MESRTAEEFTIVDFLLSNPQYVNLAVCILVGLKYNRTFVDVDEALECATYIDT
jgi:hypothetical protein